MKKLRLNIKELTRLLDGRTQAWLAKQVGMTRQGVSDHITRRTVRGAELFAPVLGVDSKDLLE